MRTAIDLRLGTLAVALLALGSSVCEGAIASQSIRASLVDPSLDIAAVTERMQAAGERCAEHRERCEFLFVERCEALHQLYQARLSAMEVEGRISLQVQQLQVQLDHAEAQGDSALARVVRGMLAELQGTRRANEAYCVEFGGRFRPLSLRTASMKPNQIASHLRTLDTLAKWLHELAPKVKATEHEALTLCSAEIAEMLAHLRARRLSEADQCAEQLRAWIFQAAPPPARRSSDVATSEDREPDRDEARSGFRARLDRAGKRVTQWLSHSTTSETCRGVLRALLEQCRRRCPRSLGVSKA